MKGWKHSKPGLWLSIGTSAFGAISIVKDVRKARGESDTLKLVNALVGAAALVTGTALLVRELRRLGDDDVLLG
ncbi:membrane protein [Streptomyces sp. XY431]|nr:membrane protein [Streptomyces sp. XY431]